MMFLPEYFTSIQVTYVDVNGLHTYLRERANRSYISYHPLILDGSSLNTPMKLLYHLYALYTYMRGLSRGNSDN